MTLALGATEFARGIRALGGRRLVITVLEDFVPLVVVVPTYWNAAMAKSLSLSKLLSFHSLLSVIRADIISVLATWLRATPTIQYTSFSMVSFSKTSVVHSIDSKSPTGAFLTMSVISCAVRA